MASELGQSGGGLNTRTKGKAAAKAPGEMCDRVDATVELRPGWLHLSASAGVLVIHDTVDQAVGDGFRWRKKVIAIGVSFGILASGGRVCSSHQAVQGVL